jgi:hypothetical protein
LLKSNNLICFSLLNHVQRYIDKSWMSARRGMIQYNDGCRAFVKFAVRNCTAVDGKIYCPCKYCRNNQRHTLDYVLTHLTGGKGMSSGYSLWYMHGETIQWSALPGRCPSHPSVTDSAAGSTEQVECTEQGRCLEQGVHEVGETCSTQRGEVNEGTSEGDALKYHELLKTAEKPLHPFTKHSKLSATVHMYNLKCIRGISNKIFSDILELIS